MKTKILFSTLAMLVLTILFTSCSEGLGNGGIDPTLTEKSGQLAPGTCGTCNFTGVLTEVEIADLLYMREEEKLARDVYLTFFDKYKSLVFNNIYKSEQVHMDAILNLIKGYGLEDPAKSEIGKFTNSDLQSLFDELILKGEVSLVEALKVGVDIEILDIDDLLKAINETDKVNIKQVYTNLFKASETHLKSFTFNLQRLGVTYP